MEISKYLKADFICSDLQATTKEEAIRELADLLKGSPEVQDFDQFLQEVFEREAAMTTGIGHQIAVPHARTEAVNNLVIAFGKSGRGIDFDAIDHQPVKLIFLLGTPKKDMGTYLKALAYLTRILKKEEFRGTLIGASSAEDIIKAFNRIEEPV